MNKLKFGKLDIQFYDIDLISKEARKESYMMQAHKWDEFIIYQEKQIYKLSLVTIIACPAAAIMMSASRIILSGS